MEVKREASVDNELAEELSGTRVAAIKHQNSASPSPSPSLNPIRPKTSRSSSSSTSASNRPLTADRLAAKPEPKEANGHDSTSTSPVKPEPKEPTKPNKNPRNSKLPPRIAPLLDDLPDVTKEATSSFTIIDACTYQNKYLGFSEHALDCDCAEEWGESAFVSHSTPH